jgi:myo-inositol catabolism protein IolS
MQYRQLGRTGINISEIGFGTWLTAGASIDTAATERLALRARELGINFFDTADSKNTTA